MMETLQEKKERVKNKLGRKLTNQEIKDCRKAFKSDNNNFKVLEARDKNLKIICD